MMNKPPAALFVILIVFCLAACSKDNTSPDDQDLTACPDGANCSYLFAANADFDEGTIGEGETRVFGARRSSSGGIAGDRLLIKTDIAAAQFHYDGSKLRDADFFMYSQYCANCSMIAIETVDGYAKGQKINGKEEWLIEVSIIRESVQKEPLLLRDTVFIKQYYAGADLSALQSQ